MKSDKVKLNLKAESAAFSEKIPSLDNNSEPIRSSADIRLPSFTSDFLKTNSFSPIELDKSSLGYNLNSFNPTPFKNENLNPSTLNTPTIESSPMPIVSDSVQPTSPQISSTALIGQENIRGVDSAPNILASSQLINASLNMNQNQNQDISKQIKNVMEKELSPVLENLGQYISNVANTNPYNANQSDEMPTIPPTNLVFLDRINRATNLPNWA
jgi:hypothetical protein